MGPPLVNGGNDSDSQQAQERDPASMGPPLVNGGNVFKAAFAVAMAAASMGPPLVNGGNNCSQDGTFGSEVGFNGAAVSERRKYGSPAHNPASFCSLQWGRR